MMTNHRCFVQTCQHNVYRTMNGIRAIGWTMWTHFPLFMTCFRPWDPLFLASPLVTKHRSTASFVNRNSLIFCPTILNFGFFSIAKVLSWVVGASAKFNYWPWIGNRPGRIVSLQGSECSADQSMQLDAEAFQWRGTCKLTRLHRRVTCTYTMLQLQLHQW